MFLNIKISKATPERALKYAIGKNILEETKTRNLITSKSPAEEMRDTASRYGKWQSPKDRKTFSLVISPNPKDNPTRAQVMEITEAVLDHFFPTIQGIIVLHKDKGKDSKKTSPSFILTSTVQSSTRQQERTSIYQTAMSDVSVHGLTSMQ